MEELEKSEEEIEIEVEEEVEVEVDEEDEEPDEENKKRKSKKDVKSSFKKPERKSIIIKKRVSGDFRKDILLRASLSEQSNYTKVPNYKSTKSVTLFNIDNYYNNKNSNPIEENIKEENENLNEKKEIEKEENIIEGNLKINNNKDIEDKKSNNNEINSKEEEEFIGKIENIIKSIEGENNLDNKKWEEKKLDLVKLNEFLEKSNKIMPYLDTFINYIKYKLNNFKETNFNVIKEGMRCLCSIFNKIKKNDKPNNKYIEIILSGLFEKITDSKLRDTYIELLELLMKAYSDKIIIDTLLALLENCKKVIVLKEYAEYIDKIIDDKFYQDDLNKKGIINFLVNLANNSNPQLRTLASKVICHLYKFIGPDLKLMIKNIKESTLKNIIKEMEKIDIEKSKNEKNKQSDNKINNIIKINDNNNENNMPNINNNSIKPVDISNLIPPKLLKEIDKGNWQEKKDGIDYIINLIENGNKKILPNGLNNLFDLINEKLSDANKNFSRMIIQLLSFLIMSLGENIKSYSKLFVKPLLLNLSDKNQLLREDCVECINKLIKNQNFEIIANFLPQITDIENSDMRNEILDLLISNINSLLNDNYSESFFKELTKSLMHFLQDKSSKIKSKSETFIILFKDKLKKDNYLKEIEKFKPSIAEDLRNILNKIFPDNKNNKKENEKEKLPIKKNNTAKKENTANNVFNKNSLFKKVDISKKPKKNKKDLLINDLNNKSTVINTPKKNINLKMKNNSFKKIVNLENDKKLMNKTVINWRKPKPNNENPLLIESKKDEQKSSIIKNSAKKGLKDNKQKPKPKLSIDFSNSKKNISTSRHERTITDSNQKSFKLSKEKPIKTERNIDNKINNKKDTMFKKIPTGKNNPISGLKKANNKIISSLNAPKEEPKLIKKNNNSNKKENKNERKPNNLLLNKEELLKILHTLLNNEEEIVSSILDVHNLVYKNFNFNKDIIMKNKDIIFQSFIDIIQKFLSKEKTDIKILKYLTNILCKICGLKELIHSISLKTHINLINMIFFFVLYEEKNRLEEDEEGIIVWKNFNSIMLRIIDYCNNTENICILIQLITLNIKEDKQKLSEYGSRCLGLINQTIKDKHNQLKINEILKEIHLFLVEYEIKHPNLEFNNKREKNIIESISGLVKELVKAKKESIMDEYNKDIEIIGKNDKYIINWIKDELNKIKEEERERDLKLAIDQDIENLLSEELLTNI